MADTLVGQVLSGKYEILKQLGRGGMAEVYQARQINLDRLVAIKLMHAFLLAEEDFLHRFKREAKAMAALNHPNIAGVFDFDVYGDNTYYLVMEYIGGGTLKTRLEELAAEGERLPLKRTVKLIIEVADALTYAHKRGMVHRDIKPANIMLDAESGKAILTDFGIVKMLGGQSVAYTATGALIGTPAYMSPEQALGKTGDERVDIYSLGVLLFQMATGALPYDADTPLAVVMKHVNDPTPLPGDLNPDVPPSLQAVILKAMAKDPDKRYQTAAEMAAALRGVDLSAPAVSPPPPATDAPAASSTPEPETAVAQAEQTDVATPTATEIGADTAAPVATPPRKRSPWLYAGIGLILLLLIGGGAASIMGLFTPTNGDNPEDLTAAAMVDVTESATPTPIPTETETPDETADANTEQSTPDVVASAVAAVRLTEEANSTATSTTTPMPSPTAAATPTPNRTTEFLEACTTDAELISAFTYNNRRFDSAGVDERFPMNWVLRNSGTCPWPSNLQWVYVEGETFDYDDGPIPLETEVLAGEAITLTTTFLAPENPGRYESTWQLEDANDEPFGPELSFTVGAFARATATPEPTDTPEAPPTPTPGEVEELNYIFEVLSCEYVGIDWRCHVRLTPFGGGGGPYTVFVFDQPAGQATEFRGAGTFNYFAQARRCAAFNANVRVIDDSQTPALTMERHLYLDPENYFEGGCEE